MKKTIAIFAAAGALALLASSAGADERFIPKGFSYKPGDVYLPPINSRRYKVISEADRREAEIYTKDKQRSEQLDYMIHSLQRQQHPLRNGWRYY